MKRIFLSLLLLLMVACQSHLPAPTLTPTPIPTSTPPSPTATLTASTTLPPSPTFATSPSATTNSTSPEGFEILVHPDGGLYIGDLISLEVISPEGSDLQGQSLSVSVPEVGGEMTLETQFSPYGIGGRLQGTLLWSWNTTGLSPGEYEITFSIPSRNVYWSETLSLLPENELPPPEPESAWRHNETDCCLVYSISLTPGERDLPDLLEVIEEKAREAMRQMGIEPEEPIGIALLPRVLGHGGFAGKEISISYLDRNYAGQNMDVVLHHEILHVLDSQLGGDLRPSLLVEGLAVYLAGGHFKPEPLTPRAAGLLPPQPGCTPAADFISGTSPEDQAEVCGLGWYLPLVPLLDDFYNSQHEVGYLQAASLVEFMVDTWGWEAFDAFYRDIHPKPELPDPPQVRLGDLARAVNAALVAHFGITVQQLEQMHLASLEQENLLPEWVEDVRLSVEFYDTVRRYQQVLDPSAYFLTAWLPDGEAMRSQGIVADYLRRPSAPENIALEIMLVEADAQLEAQNFTSVAETIDAANLVLDSIQRDNPQPFSAHELASQYYAIVDLLLDQGFQPQRIHLEKETAQAWVTEPGLGLMPLSLALHPDGWVITAGTQIPATP